MNIWHIMKQGMAAFLCVIAVGCSYSSEFDRQLAAAEKLASTGMLCNTALRQIHVDMLDQYVSNEEQHRRVNAVIKSIVDSGSLLWLDEFYQRGHLDGEFGHYTLTVVWQFALAHPDIFFSSPLSTESADDDNFLIAAYNPGLVFDSIEDAQNALQAIENFAMQSDGATKHRAETWASEFRSALDDELNRRLPFRPD